MSNEMIQNMERFIDDPSNGIMLEPITHIVFDRLKIYFQRNPEVRLQGFIVTLPFLLIGISARKRVYT